MSTAVVEGRPWQPAAVVASTRGFNAAIFSMPGHGKTAFAASAQDHPAGRDVFFFAIDAGIRTLADRMDIMVWPKLDREGLPELPTWDGMMNLSSQLRRPGKNPFRTIVLDDLTKTYGLAREKVVGGKGIQPSLQQYGTINNMVIAFVEEWANYSRRTGCNFIVNAHAEEVLEGGEGELAVIKVRIATTPGVAKELPVLLDSIGYLEMKDATRSTAAKRKLILHATTKSTSKYRQPLTGEQLPNEIENPTMGVILDHIDKLGQAQRKLIQPEGLVNSPS
jgi:AAA domain